MTTMAINRELKYKTQSLKNVPDKVLVLNSK